MPESPTHPIQKFFTKQLERLFNLDKLQFDTITVSSDVIRDMIDFAKANHPKEFVAFFHGVIMRKTLVIDALVYNEFESSEYSAAPIFHFADKSFYGSVHSHPGYSARPSRADLAFFRKTGIIHAIICMPYTPESIIFYNHHGELINVTIQ